MTLQKYLCADNGGGMNVTVSRDIASSWETFKVRCLATLFCACNVLLAVVLYWCKIDFWSCLVKEIFILVYSVCKL